MEEKRVRRKYDRQFKLDAVDMVLKQGRSVASVARDLGVDSNTLHLWKNAAMAKHADAFPGHGNLSVRTDGADPIVQQIGDVNGPIGS